MSQHEEDRPMNRFRFRIPGDDGRPMAFPPEGPFWTTGYGDDYITVVAFSPSLEVLTQDDRWPDAFDIEDEGPTPINFTSRFQKPDWYDDDQEHNRS